MYIKRVAILTGHYPPPFTANAVRAYYMVKALRKYGYDVIVIPLISSWSGRRIGFFGEEVIPPYTNVRSELERPSLFNRMRDLLIKQKDVNKLLDLINRYRISRIIGTLPPIEAIPIASYIAEELNIPLVADVQDLAEDYRIMERPYLYPFIRYYFRSVYSAMSKAELLLVTTEYMKEVVRARVKLNNIVVIPNGADTSRYAECFKIRTHQLQEPIAVFLGDLNWKYHNVDSFIKALKILNDHQKIKIYLKVIGTGRLLPELKRLTKELNLYEQVKFYGYLRFEDLIPEMGKSTFAIAGRPARDNLWIKTSMRLTIYEYLACGLPVLAYGPPNSYTEYFINKYKVGIYIGSDEPEEIACTIQEKLNELININPREIINVARQYSWDNIMDNFVEFVERAE